MDAVKFLAEYNRMCNTYNNCVGCPMHDKPFCHPHDITTNDERKELVDVVEKWSKEHPIATNEMSDTISRAMAINALESIGSIDTEADKEYARSVFEALPSAYHEQKKGEWIPEFNGKCTYWFSCSKCKRIVPEVRNGGWNFCPNCGSYNGGENHDKG